MHYSYDNIFQLITIFLLLIGSRWKVKNLSYRISKYPNNLKPREVDKEIQKAFQVWSEYTDLTFKQQSSGAVHIEIRFEKGEHGDGDPFDGPGGTLAHAYFPVSTPQNRVEEVGFVHFLPPVAISKQFQCF